MTSPISRSIRFPHEPFIDRIWELRNDLSAYDAAYLALAEAISIPLITCDAGLATVARRTVDVELLPAAGRLTVRGCRTRRDVPGGRN